MVDVRRLFYIAAALGAWPFRSTNVPSSSSAQRSAVERYAALRLPLANGRAYVGWIIRRSFSATCVARRTSGSSRSWPRTWVAIRSRCRNVLRCM